MPTLTIFSWILLCCQGFCGVDVHLKTLPALPGQTQGLRVVWVAHNFGFLGGSLGCAEGERITRAFEYAKAQRLPIVVQVRDLLPSS